MTGSRDSGHGASRRRLLVWLPAALAPLAYAVAEQSPAGQVIGQWVLTMAIAAFVAACVLIAVSARGAERGFWALLGVGSAAVFGSQLYWSVFITAVNPAGPEPMSLSNVLDLAGALAFILMIGRLTWTYLPSRLSWWRRAADGTTLALAAFATLLVYVVAPAFHSVPRVPADAALLGALYPVLGAVLFAATVSQAVGYAGGKRSSWEPPLGIGLALFAAAVGFWPVWFLSKLGALPWPLGAACDLSWLIGLGLIGGAAVMRLLRDDEGWPVRGREPSPLGFAIARAASVVAPAAALAAIALLALRLYAPEPGLPAWVIVVCLVVLVSALAGEGALLAIEMGVLADDSRTDPVTGLPVHRYFHERVDVELELARRYEERLVVAVLDLDDFSRVNDAFGHAAGDDVLRSAAAAIVRVRRERDVACRLGGDRFGLVLPETTREEAFALLERVRQALAETPLGPVEGIGVSIGYAMFPESRDRDEMIRHAEGACYWAKSHGRARVVAFDPAVVSELTPAQTIRRLEASAGFETIDALVALLNARGLRSHGDDVSQLSMMLAVESGLEVDRVTLVGIAAKLHDVGCIGLADALLEVRPSRTERQEEQLRAHPELSERILASTPFPESAKWARWHHERWDGTGYPDGLAGEEMPIEVRIIALADRFDALTSPPAGLSVGAALQEIDLALGSEFDPVLGDRFIRLVSRMRLTEQQLEA